MSFSNGRYYFRFLIQAYKTEETISSADSECPPETRNILTWLLQLPLLPPMLRCRRRRRRSPAAIASCCCCSAAAAAAAGVCPGAGAGDCACAGASADADANADADADANAGVHGWHRGIGGQCSEVFRSSPEISCW